MRAPQMLDTSVRTQITVEAPIERAFKVFTEGIGSWWDPNHHILQGELQEMVFEPFVGGHIIDRGVDCRTHEKSLSGARQLNGPIKWR